jgi:hypothetical protein
MRICCAKKKLIKQLLEKEDSSRINWNSWGQKNSEKI